MQTTINIKAYAYPVKLKDHRTGVSKLDTIVIPAEWLRICGSMGLEICDDKHMIYRAYNRSGFEVTEIGNRRRITLSVDLERLYAEHNGTPVQQSIFEGLGVATYGQS
ncbi:MAG: hypothetical protein IJB59_11500 [Oscillospiraceae bacterium]|nr:hypothetical protein [Oscillospiraceae bacterium]